MDLPAPSQRRRVKGEYPPGLSLTWPLTTRLAEELAVMSLSGSAAEAARRTGVSVSITRRLFKRVVEDLNQEYRPSPTWAIGIDEAHIRGRVQATISDPVHNRLLDILPKRSQEAIVEALSRLEWRGDIRLAVIDLHRPYRKALKEALPNAVIIADRYHVAGLARTAMLRVRETHLNKLPRTLTQVRSEGRLRERLKLLLIKRWRTIAPKNQAYLRRLFHHHRLLGQAYWAKEDFAAIYDSPTRAEAEQRYAAWRGSLPKALLPWFGSVARTVDAWHDEIFAYFDHELPPSPRSRSLQGPRRPTAGLTEAMNGRIKDIDREGRGNTRFHDLRAKVLVRLGTVPEDFIRAIARRIVGE